MKKRYLFGLIFLLGIPHSGQTSVHAAGFNIRIKNFAFAPQHSILEDTEGKFYVLGESSNWALLGRESSITTVTERTNVLPLQAEETILQYDVGYDFNIFLTSNGRVLTSGRNDSGQIGNNTLEQYYGEEIPVDITSQFNLDDTVNETIVKVIASFTSPVIVHAISSEGRVFNWGANPTLEDVEAGVDNYSYQVGKNLSGRTDVESIRVPFDLDLEATFPGLAEDERIIDIEYANLGGFALTSLGGIYAWGRNEDGILGLNEADTEFIASPTRITSLETDIYLSEEMAIDMEFSYGQMVVLTNQNRLIAWGKNNLKQLSSSDATLLLSPEVVDTSSIVYEEGESVLDYHVGGAGIYFVTTLGQIWMRGYTLITSAGNYSNQFAETYRADKYWLNVTGEMPVLQEGEVIKEITGYGDSFLFFTSEGRLITQYRYPLDGLLIGANANYVSAQYDNAVYKVFINEETEHRLEVLAGDTFTLPKLDAEPGFYHSGWSYSREGSPSFSVDKVFTMNFESNFRIFALYTEGEDPDASSETMSSETTGSSTVTSSITTGSEPETSEPSGPRPSAVLPIVVVVSATAALGGGVYYFGIKGGAIGGFSLATLKKWFFALIKRKKDKEDDDQNKKK